LLVTWVVSIDKQEHGIIGGEYPVLCR